MGVVRRSPPAGNLALKVNRGLRSMVLNYSCYRSELLTNKKIPPLLYFIYFH